MTLKFGLAGGLVYSCCVLQAQVPKQMDPGVGQRVIQTDDGQGPYVPMAEREWTLRVEGQPQPPNTGQFVPPEAPKNGESAAGGMVSIHSLKNPLSAKSRKLLTKAQDQLARHDDAAAKKTLAEAMELEDARPYAMAATGSMQLTQYVHDKDPRMLSAAHAALMEAVPEIPGDVAARSNLGLAYYLAGEQEQALAETTKALQMDPARAKTRYVMGLILCEDRKYSEAVYHLKLAAPELRAAKDLLEKVEKLAAESPALAQK